MEEVIWEVVWRGEDLADRLKVWLQEPVCSVVLVVRVFGDNLGKTNINLILRPFTETTYYVVIIRLVRFLFVKNGKYDSIKITILYSIY